MRKRPGLAPAALFHLIGNSVFLRLSEVASGLPPYEERVLLSSMDTEPDGNGLVAGPGAEPVVCGDASEADASERQRTLFSWAEFMAGEPEESSRKRRDEAPTLSLFEWALEQEQAGSLAGAAR